MAKYEIKDAKTANLDEIYFDKNVGKMCYKNALGIIKELETAPPAPGLETNPTTNFLPSNWLGEFADSPINLSIAPSGYLGWAKLSTKIGSLISPPVGKDQTNIAPYLDNYGLSILNNAFTGAKTIIGDYAGAIGSSPMRLNLETPISGAAKAYIDSSNSLGISNVFEVNASGDKIRLGQGFSYTSSNILNGIYAEAELGLVKLNGGMTSGDTGVFSSFGPSGITRIGTSDYFGLGVSQFYYSILIGSAFTEGPAPTNPTTPVDWVSVITETGGMYMIPLYQ